MSSQTLTRRRPSKKTLTEFVAQVEEAHPQAKVEIWAFDEHRIGLLPISGRGWAKKNSSPVRPVETRYQWLYLYGFVQPQTGRTHFLTLPRMNAVLYNQALADFAVAVGADLHRRIVLVVDGAGSHRSHELVVPAGLHLLTLPAYSPELQPAERLWSLTNEPLLNRHFANLAELESVQVERCANLATLQEEVRGRALFHWWTIIAK